jgi:hypothetical protein
MKYKLEMISCDEVPESIYIYDRDKVNTYYKLVMYNGLVYYYPIRNNTDIDFNEILSDIRYNYEYFTRAMEDSDCKNEVARLQDYFFKEFDNYLNYEDVRKVYYLIKNNLTEIEELLNEYPEEN